MAKDEKSMNVLCGDSIYLFAVIPVRVRWNNLNLILPLTRELDEQHQWNFITWFNGSSPGFPLKLGMSEGILVGMVGHPFICRTRSLVSRDKSSRFNVARNGDMIGGVISVWYVGGTW